MATPRAPRTGDTVELFYGCKGEPWKAFPVDAQTPGGFIAGEVEYHVSEHGETWRWPTEERDS